MTALVCLSPPLSKVYLGYISVCVCMHVYRHCSVETTYLQIWWFESFVENEGGNAVSWVKTLLVLLQFIAIRLKIGLFFQAPEGLTFWRWFFFSWYMLCVCCPFLLLITLTIQGNHYVLSTGGGLWKAKTKKCVQMALTNGDVMNKVFFLKNILMVIGTG